MGALPPPWPPPDLSGFHSLFPSLASLVFLFSFPLQQVELFPKTVTFPHFLCPASAEWFRKPKPERCWHRDNVHKGLVWCCSGPIHLAETPIFCVLSSSVVLEARQWPSCSGRSRRWKPVLASSGALALVLLASCQGLKLWKQATATRKRLMTYGFHTFSKWRKSSLRLHGIRAIHAQFLTGNLHLRRYWQKDKNQNLGF